LSSIVGEARTVGQFVAPVHQRLSALAQNLWWSWDSESDQSFPRSRPGAVAEVRSQPDRLAAGDRARSLESARRSWRCMVASTMPIAGCRSI
jgi:hypothetical protein